MISEENDCVKRELAIHWSPKQSHLEIREIKTVDIKTRYINRVETLGFDILRSKK